MIGERIGLWGRAAAVIFGLLMAQVGVMLDLPLFGAVADLMLLSAIAAGLVAGPDRGATFGFAAGLAYDLMLDTPFGLSALSFAVAGYLAGVAIAWVVQPRWWASVVAAVVISLVAVLLSVGVARVVGWDYKADDVVRMCLIVAAWNGALILPARRLARWVFGQEEDSTSYRMAMP